MCISKDLQFKFHFSFDFYLITFGEDRSRYVETCFLLLLIKREPLKHFSFSVQLAKGAALGKGAASAASSHQKPSSGASASPSKKNPSSTKPSSPSEKDPRYYPAPNVYIDKQPDRVRYVTYEEVGWYIPCMLQGELSENPVACVQVMYLYSQFHFFDTMLLGFVVFVQFLFFFCIV